ncbi:MAG: M24 family metallopeptidase [Spirochaetota bacterium]
MFDLEKVKKAIRLEALNGWLFFNFKHRDIIADRLLEIPKEAVNSRPWFYVIYASGKPVKINHVVEKGILNHLPGKQYFYSSREELGTLLAHLGKGTFGAQISTHIPVISLLDHGTALFLQEKGFELVTSTNLIQRTLSTLDEKGIAFHEEAARELYDITGSLWERIAEAFSHGSGDGSQFTTEGGLQTWIMKEFEKRSLVTDHPPIVATGNNSSDPHYVPDGRGRELSIGDIVQFDLWAKKQEPGAIYADIAWVGVLSQKVSPQYEKIFTPLTNARDFAAACINEKLSKEQPITGYEVDREVRAYFSRRGFEKNLKHRTGHGIDTECHGSGVNLDSVEFPDHRNLIPGSCFSIEPGLYLDTFGMRTEINVYIRNNNACISGGKPQERILTLS